MQAGNICLSRRSWKEAAMTSDGLNQNTDGISRLLSAAESFARTEVDRIAQVVIHLLQVQPPIGIFGDDIAARHQWDEYC